jgi:hypothetical protein
VGDAISRYQDLLRVKNLTKQQRRDIQLKIHQLQQSSESEASGFDLDIGNLKLPTGYDLRKAFDPIRKQVQDSKASLQSVRPGDLVNASISHRSDVSTQVAAQVNVYVNDKNAADDVYAAIDRAMGTTVRARMRSRRHR